MKLALIGASGFVGAAVLQEALNRGHQVTGLVRRPEKLPNHPHLSARAANVYHAEQLATKLADHDAVIHAFCPSWASENLRQHFIDGSRAIIDATQQAKVDRLLIVGGAGSLYVAPNLQLIDTPEFPAEYREGAEGARETLRMIQKNNVLDWSFISPPLLLIPGERTGQFRTGDNQLLMDGDKPASISVADLAVAIIDELEQPQQVHEHFTVGY